VGVKEMNIFVEILKGWLVGAGILTIGSIVLWMYLKWWSKKPLT